MPRYHLWIEYDGNGFCGWQAQKNSVQLALSDALFSYCGVRAIIYGAGRTDSGVHALAQAAHLDLPQEKPAEELCAAMNFYLRQDGKLASILAAQKTDGDFHARFSATQRHYLYAILNRKAPPILWARRAWHISRLLDVDVMNQAARLFIGRHDFTTFRAAGCQASSAVRTLDQFSVRHQGQYILITASARSFLYRQVRSLVGALVAVGLGKLSLEELRHRLMRADRALCPPPAPPYGLYLARVDYPRSRNAAFVNLDVEDMLYETLAAHS